MLSLSNISIRKKLVLLFTTTAAISVLIACTTMWVYQLISDRATLRTEELATAQLIGDSSGPALLFKDAAAATETLALLRADPRIETACLYDLRKHVAARFSSNPLVSSCPLESTGGTNFTQNHLLVFRQITFQNEPVGSLAIEVSLAGMYSSLLRFCETGSCVLLITTIFAYLLSSFLQRIISQPIIHLTRIATQVSEEGNYLLRAKSSSQDETGLLIGQFNSMMEKIQLREADLKEAHTTLEDTVTLRTQDLRAEIVERKQVELDLVAAKLAAEESNRAKSLFLATMSHELRTPLNAIIGYSEMLLEDAQAAEDASTAGDLGKILESARHLLSLIGEVLDYSKIEAGKMTMYPEMIAMHDLLHEVLPTAEILARKNRNKLHVKQESIKGWVLVDPLRFRQCLLNLISNACKFTEDGAISIQVKEEHREGSDWATWSVSDTGIGIAENMFGKLFQTFSQVDSSSSRRFGGSGLGLAITQQLCQAMEGDVTVESEAGVGSTFTIRMPLYAQPAERSF